MILFTLAALGWQRINHLACRLREARRLRRDIRQLSRMSAHELRDIGLSGQAMALAAARAPSHCCR